MAERRENVKQNLGKTTLTIALLVSTVGACAPDAVVPAKEPKRQKPLSAQEKFSLAARLMENHPDSESAARQAAQLFSGACYDDEHAESCVELGKLYASGEALPKDMKKAEKLFKKACNVDSRWCSTDRVEEQQKPPEATAEGVGSKEQEPKTDQPTPETGKISLQEAKSRCEKEDARACFLLGNREQDNDAKRILFERACTLGYANGCTGAASTIESGITDDDDAAQVVKKIQESERQELFFHDRACTLLSAYGCFSASLKVSGAAKSLKYEVQACKLNNVFCGGACKSGDKDSCKLVSKEEKEGMEARKKEEKAQKKSAEEEKKTAQKKIDQLFSRCESNKVKMEALITEQRSAKRSQSVPRLRAAIHKTQILAVDYHQTNSDLKEAILVVYGTTAKEIEMLKQVNRRCGISGKVLE